MTQSNFSKMFIFYQQKGEKGKVSAMGRTSTIATWKLSGLLENADNASVSSQNVETEIDIRRLSENANTIT